MLDLTYFQSLFDEERTDTRCKKVLDEVAPVVKPIFDRFLREAEIGGGDENEYYVRSYDTTLSTTYSDSRNPKYAAKKEHSNIGRKYFIGMYRKVNGREYNIFTFEINGMTRKVFIHADIYFIPFWAWYKNNQLSKILPSIPENYKIFTGYEEKRRLEKQDIASFIKSSIKPRKRPTFQIGLDWALEEKVEKEVIIERLLEVWDGLRDFQQLFREEMDTAQAAYETLMQLARVRDINETTLLGREYDLAFGEVEDFKTGKRQAFQLYEAEQMITNGFMYFWNYHDKLSPNQIIAVQLEGHNHIWTGAREILGTGKKEWWITKSFTMQSKNNQEVLARAMALLTEHQIKTKGPNYFIGTYDNEERSFSEGTSQVKKNLLDAALLFAHASERIELPEEKPDTGKTDDEDINPEEEIEPNFHLEEIYQLIENSRFTFSKEVIRDLHLNLTSLDEKHFVLLTGISGTGKTQLCRLYANGVYGLEYEQENPYFTIIPVRPDWTDASALFGYYSTFEQRYVKTEFLHVLLRALKERDKPHFILLDEMNLARVEYYLSDYLSAVESRKEVLLHQHPDIEDIPQKIMIPPNVYLLGTLNVDETTHSVSDKVLDRAFVMSLSEVDFDAFWNRAETELKENLAKEFSLLKELHHVLSAYDLHFGYRTIEEILQKLYSNSQLPGDFQMTAMEALDRAIAEKVLTKIRGDERIAEMLEEIENWLITNIEEKTISLGHINRMQEELEYYGATQFWR